jgi:hypothetical protein
MNLMSERIRKWIMEEMKPRLPTMEMIYKEEGVKGIRNHHKEPR